MNPSVIEYIILIARHTRFSEKGNRDIPIRVKRVTKQDYSRIPGSNPYIVMSYIV